MSTIPASLILVVISGHAKKSKMDAENPKVQEWEKLMWNYQQELPWAQDGEKWLLLEKVFQLI